MGQVYSHSRLSAFEDCRLKFKFIYIDHLKRDTDSVEAFLGSRFHEVMEDLYKNIQCKTPTVDDLKRDFDESWDKNWHDDILIVRKDRTAGDYRAIGHKALENYHKRYHPFKDGRVIGIEKRVLLDLDGTGRYRVQGYIDRLMEREDGHYEIHDYKTAGHLPEQVHLDAGRQLALYEIGVRATWPDVKEVDLVWHYVVFDKELRSHRRPEQLEALKRDTIALIDTIESTTDYPPTESPLCQWCNYQDLCPLFAHEKKTGALPINEYLKDDGVTLVNKYADLAAKKAALNAGTKKIDEEMKKIEEAVIAKTTVENVTRLVGSDRVLNVKDELTIDYPKTADKNRPDFAQRMSDMGLWDAVTDINSSSLKKVARDQNWAKAVPEGLKEFVRVESSKKITLSKKKDRE